MDGTDSGYPTPTAQRLRRLAQEIADACPYSVGEEIALIGSAASGWADEMSDFELDLYVENEPDRDEVAVWAQEKLGVTSMVLGEEGGGCHLIGLYRDSWLEVQWRTVSATDELIDTVLSGESTSRSQLVTAHVIAGALPLRTAGVLAGWQSRLEAYPEGLAGRVVSEATDFWRAPHRVEALWALAERGHVFSLVEWLQADIQDALRVLFAINHKWEPDWKWLRHHLNTLSLGPERLAERIESVFLTSNPHTAVAIALQIIEDVLLLAAPKFAVSSQLANVQAAQRYPSAPPGSHLAI